MGGKKTIGKGLVRCLFVGWETKMATRQQSWQMAYCEVFAKKGEKIEESYARVCRIFPALAHNSGLCQAVGFAQSKANNKGSVYAIPKGLG